ncbi:hypothetical protein RYX36_009279, partial [Vicia faba]
YWSCGSYFSWLFRQQKKGTISNGVLKICNLWVNKHNTKNLKLLITTRRGSKHHLPPQPPLCEFFPLIFTYNEDNSFNNFDPNRKIDDGRFSSVYLRNICDKNITNHW